MTENARRDDYIDASSNPDDETSEPLKPTHTGIPDDLDRAQPGDVLGIETGGETTSIGETSEDEDRRREDAEEDNREIHDEQHRDRKPL